jgi:HD-like signal output (HDOD) protein
MQALYQWQQTGQDMAEICEQFVQREDGKSYTSSYFRELMHGVPTHLKEVDSSLGPVLDRSIESVDQVERAIVRLGADTTHKLVLTFALRELFNTHSKVLKTQMQKLLEHSVKVSAVCFVLAKISGRFNPEHALLAGLLHDIGNVAILNYAEKYNEVANDSEKLAQVMRDLRSRIGSEILRKWGFIDDLILVTEEAENWYREHDGEADYADLVIVSQLHTFIGSEQMKHLPTLDQVPAVNRLDIGELTPKLSLKILDKADEKIERAQRMLTS